MNTYLCLQYSILVKRHPCLEILKVNDGYCFLLMFLVNSLFRNNLICPAAFQRVRVRVVLPGRVPTARPLPRTMRESPKLTVECYLTTQPGQVLALVIALAPVDGR